MCNKCQLKSKTLKNNAKNHLKLTCITQIKDFNIKLLKILTKIAPETAAKKLATIKPGTSHAVNNNIPPLISTKNRPKLKIVNGKVNKVKIGLINVLTNPNIKAAQKPAPKLIISIPGISWAVKIRANIEINNPIILFIIFPPLT